MLDDKVIIREKRRTPRVKQEVPIELVIKEDVNTINGKTCDLSCVGAKILLNTSLPAQTQHTITLDLPSGKQQAQCVVVRSEKVNDMYEISLYFNDITMDVRRRINDFVKEKWI